MKKFIASAGFFALGVAGSQAAYSPGLTSMETTKPWSVSAALRGFFDDNRAAAPSGLEEGSFGVEIRPSISVNLPTDQTLFKFGYTYSGRWYDQVENSSSSAWDQTHIASFLLDHAFSQLYSVDLYDSFTSTQEPDLLQGGGTPLRTSQNSIYNQAGINFHAQLTDLVKLVLGYQNTFYDYSDESTSGGGTSYSGLLDRMEHLAIVNLRWQAMPQTVAVLGYQYGVVGYTGDEVISGGNVMSDNRDYTSHYVYAGADHTFNPDLTGSLRAGAQYTDYSNPTASGVQVTPDPAWSPYLDASLNWAFMPDDSVTLGIRHVISATDVIAPDSSGEITANSEATTAYVNLAHQITPSLKANALGTVQWTTFNGGASDNDNETFYAAGVNLAYRFNQYFGAEAGYNYDHVASDSSLGGRSYTRNRVYIGVTVVY